MRVLLGALLIALAGCGGASSPAAVMESSTAEPTPAPPPEPTPSEPVTPRALPGGPLRSPALAVLETVIRREASNPKNAWGLAHGILAMGPEFGASDGRAAVTVLVDDFMKAARVEGHSGLHPYFEDKTEDGWPVEPHTDLILKTLIEAGLPLDEPLVDKVGAPTLERLYRGSRARFAPSQAQGREAFAAPDDVAWSIQAWCQGVSAGQADQWEARGLRKASLQTVTEQQLAMLEAETWFMRQAMNKGETVAKRRQGIFAFTCGGAHLYQAVEACAKAGYPKDKNVQQRLAGLNAIYLWRVPLETGLIEQAMGLEPTYAPMLYNQDVKFLGHMLESLGKAERDGLFTPTEEERSLLDDAEERMLVHVTQMDRLGVYRPDKLAGWLEEPGTRQFYLDVVGDASHAFAAVRIQAALREQRGR